MIGAITARLSHTAAGASTGFRCRNGADRARTRGYRAPVARTFTRRELVVAGAGAAGLLALGGFGLSRVLSDSDERGRVRAPPAARDDRARRPHRGHLDVRRGHSRPRAPAEAGRARAHPRRERPARGDDRALARRARRERRRRRARHAAAADQARRVVHLRVRAARRRHVLVPPARRHAARPRALRRADRRGERRDARLRPRGRARARRLARRDRRHARREAQEAARARHADARHGHERRLATCPGWTWASAWGSARWT